MNSRALPNWLIWAVYAGTLLLLSLVLEHCCPWASLRPFISVGVMIAGGLGFVLAVHGLPILTALFSLQRKLELAEKTARLSQSIYTGLFPGSREHALQLTLLAEVLRQQCRFAEAEEAVRQSLSILEAAGGRAESQSALGHDILGALLRDQDKHAQAVGEGREAVAILDECLRKTDEKAPDYGRLRRAQANSCLQLGLSFNASANPEMALEYLHRALDLPADLDQGGRLRANIFAALAAAYLQLGEFKEAECAALSALDLVASPLGAEDELARARALAAAYAVILQAPGKSSDERLKAQAMLVEASALRKKWLRPGDPELRN